jgi:hypothetical protein
MTATTQDSSGRGTPPGRPGLRIGRTGPTVGATMQKVHRCCDPPWLCVQRSRRAFAYPPQMPESVTHVSGMNCYLSARKGTMLFADLRSRQFSGFLEGVCWCARFVPKISDPISTLPAYGAKCSEPPGGHISAPSPESPSRLAPARRAPLVSPGRPGERFLRRHRDHPRSTRRPRRLPRTLAVH